MQKKLLSVADGHANAFLREVKASCKSAVPKVASSDGALSFEALSMCRPGFREGVEKGRR